MHSEIRETAQWGKVLFIGNERVEVGVALDFGIRVVHLSCVGMENLFYRQPNDLSDNFVKNNGWRLYGGRRLWMAPESADSYYPDNAPVRYTLEQSGVLLEQNPDPLLHLKKSLRITFLDDGSVAVENRLQNIGDEPITGASWGVNTLDGGGTAVISFGCGVRGGYNPKRVVSLWSDTDLHDPRLSFTKDSLTAKHIAMPGYLKIGLYANPGRAVFQNKGQQLTIGFDAQPLEQYMDNGCNFALYMCKQFMELETLGTRTQMLPGELACHTEVWQLAKL